MWHGNWLSTISNSKYKKLKKLKMKRKKMMLSVVIAFTALLSQQVNAQDTTMPADKNKMSMDKMPYKKIM